MGKDNQETAEQPESENKNPSEEKPKEENKTEETEEKQDEKKDNAEKLRKVIKVDDKKPEENKQSPSVDTSTREGLEQKRAILQSIKDFDFQIKKNQEELTVLNKKLDSVSKDLDDLVSLYEIVSEQMNPFVGLSKVTKKRLDALENFTREIEQLKERTGELESFATRSGAKLNRINDEEPSADTIDTEKILGNDEDEKEAKGEIEAPTPNESEESKLDENNVVTADENQDDQESESDEKEISEKIQDEDIEENTPMKEPKENLEDLNEVNINQQIETEEYILEEDAFQGLTDADIDIIFDKAFGDLSPEGKVDYVIDEFIENLKG